MMHKSALIATVLMFCLVQSVVSLGALTPAAAFRANMQQRESYQNPLFYTVDVPLGPYGEEIKDPIIKRFKPCYYSPIQCLIKK